MFSLPTGHLHKLMIYSECKSPCSAQYCCPHCGIAPTSKLTEVATLLEMRLSAEVMKHLITLLLKLVIEKNVLKKHRMVTQTDVCSSAMKIIQRCKVLGHSCSPKACNLENCHGMKVRLCTWFCWLTGRWVDPVKASLDMMLNLELPPMHGSV